MLTRMVAAWGEFGPGWASVAVLLLSSTSTQLWLFSSLTGWDKHSYGYHGDDGHSFCSSGTGQPYGPTFTTGDVIGCCVNLINGTCFYTKNGHSLGGCIGDLARSALWNCFG